MSPSNLLLKTLVQKSNMLDICCRYCPCLWRLMKEDNQRFSNLAFKKLCFTQSRILYNLMHRLSHKGWREEEPDTFRAFRPPTAWYKTATILIQQSKWGPHLSKGHLLRGTLIPKMWYRGSYIASICRSNMVGLQDSCMESHSHFMDSSSWLVLNLLSGPVKGWLWGNTNV